MDINKAAERARGAVQAQQRASEEIARRVVAETIEPLIVRIEALEAEIAELKARIANDHS